MNVKNIFKKNQVIIFALAIMICVAGYLTFAQESEKAKTQVSDAGNVGEELFADMEGDQVVDTDLNNELYGETLLENNVNVSDLDVIGDMVSEKSDEIEDKDKDNTNPLDEDKDKEKETIKEAAQPGEAVLVTNTVDSGYFLTTKLTREQQRAKNKANLMDIIENEALDEASKADAIDAIQQMNIIADKENVTEILLEAKGFDDAVVCILEDSVDVIVNTPSLNEQDMAIIEDVVVRKTGYSVDKIFITPGVIEE